MTADSTSPPRAAPDGARPVLTRHDLTHPDGRAFHVYGELSGDLTGQTAATGHDVARLHRRFDRLTGTWVRVSPSRNSRPGGLAAGQPPGEASPPTCPLCPGGPELPWPYEIAVFDNRFPSLSVNAPSAKDVRALDARAVDLPSTDVTIGRDCSLLGSSTGRCQVVVYTGAHEGSLAALTPQQLTRVIAVWRDRSTALWAEGHAYVMAFENRGAAVGATLAHPHGQLYAFDHDPPVTITKATAHANHRATHGSCLGCTLAAEDDRSRRALFANDSFVVAVPFAARWPYEVHIRSRRHGLGRLGDLTDAEAVDLARAITETVDRLDALFGFELPFLLCVQEAPPSTQGSACGLDDWHLHVEFLPPHRSAERLKIRASVETALGIFINDTVPEDSAAALRGDMATDATSTSRANNEGSWAGIVVPTIVAALP